MIEQEIDKINTWTWDTIYGFLGVRDILIVGFVVYAYGVYN